MRVIQNNTVAIYQKRISFARVTLRQNFYQPVKIKINGEQSEKFTIPPVNHFGNRHAIIARPVVKIRRRYRETVRRIIIFFSLNVPRSILHAPIRIARLPAVIHDNLVLLVRIRHVTRRNVLVFFRYSIQKCYRRLIIVQNFRLTRYRVGKHAEDTFLLNDPIR